MIKEWKVTRGDEHKSLLEFLQGRLKEKEYSRKKIKGFIDTGYCFINGKSDRFSKTLLPLGAIISLRVPDIQRETLAIVFEDDTLLVINKPAGMTCDDRLERTLQAMGKKATLVHRLDKNTTGLLVLAKTEAAKSSFLTQFEERKVQKRYVAIVQGKMQAHGTIENKLGPVASPEGQVKWGVVAHGHFAHTNWKTLQTAKGYSFVELTPLTGRTHQLRVHLASKGHPIAGDYLYGCAPIVSVVRPLLHASYLEFTHPELNTQVSYTISLPRDMIAAGKTLLGLTLCIS